MNVLGMLGIALALWGMLAVLGLSPAWCCILVGAYLCITTHVIQRAEQRRSQAQRVFSDWLTKYFLRQFGVQQAPKQQAEEAGRSAKPNERGH